jgi:hypothetical protein
VSLSEIFLTFFIVILASLLQGPPAGGCTVQVPANPTATASALNVPMSGTSSAVWAKSRAAGAKNGQLPPFAEVLTGHSVSPEVDSEIGKDADGKPGATDEKDAAAMVSEMPAPELKSSDRRYALFSPHSGEVQDAIHSQGDAHQESSVSAKSGAKTGRHHAMSGPTLKAPDKKLHAAVKDASSPVLPTPVPPVAVQATSKASLEQESRTPLRLSLPSNAAAIQQPVSSLQVQKDEHAHASGSSIESSAVATPEKVSSPVTDSTKIPAPSQIASSEVQTQSLADAQSSHLEGLFSAQQSSYERKMSFLSVPKNGVDGTALPVDVTAQGEGPRVAVPAISKTKTLEKASNTVTPRSVPAAEASSTQPVRTGNDMPMIAASSRSAEIAGSIEKQPTAALDINTFQRLDSGQVPSTLLHSSAHQIAVGIQDPSLGWLEVQTQSSAGHVNATLTAATAEAHASLAVQAPAITQYLADRNVPIQSLNVHTQADMQGGTSGGGQSQPGPENTRQQQMPERGGIVETGRPAVLSETNTRRIDSASYISIRA